MESKTIELNRSDPSGSYIVGKIVCDATADYNQNNSDVTCRLYVRKANDSTQFTIPTSGTWSYGMTINGKSFSGTVSKDVLLDWILLATVSVSDIAHNDDGTKTIAISGWIIAPGGTTLAGHNTNGSGSFTLDTVPRASVITAAYDVAIGNQCMVRWIPASASFRYKLRFSIGNWSGTTDTIHPNRTTEYTYTGFVFPMEAANQIQNSRTGTMTLTLYTYSDSGAVSQVGSADTKTFTVFVPDNSDTKPKVTMALSPVGDLPSAFAGLYIQGLTKVQATLSAKGQYGTSIESYLMKVDGESYGSDVAHTSRYLSDAGRKTVYGYATDHRGHTGESTQTIDVIAYSSPKLEGTTAVRCDNNGNPSDSGTYLKIHAKRSYSHVISGGTQRNFCAIRYKYTQDGVTWTPWVTILDFNHAGSDEITTGALLNGLLSTETSYVVCIRAIDSIGRYSETNITIPTEKVYMDRDGKRNAIGLGKYNEHDNAVDSAWGFYMNGNKITGLPMPLDDTDAVPKAYAAPADIKMVKTFNNSGWYKLGTISGAMCGAVTLTIGGVYYYNQPSISMVDIATEFYNARAFLRIPALVDEQISKVGVIQEADTVYGVYAYYKSTQENRVNINVHTHMGEFTPADWIASSVSDSDMIATIALKK